MYCNPLKISGQIFGSGNNKLSIMGCAYLIFRRRTETSNSTYRYKCKWQVDHANKYTIGATLNGKSAVLQALDLIEKCKREEKILGDGATLQSLEMRREKLKRNRKNLLALSIKGIDFDMNDYKELKEEIDRELSTVEDAIAKYEIDKAKREKKIFDMEAIKDRLNTIIDLKGYKVSEEMIDLFVERIIYRGVIRGNDEFLWVMNLSGEAADTSAKYKIRGYDKEYADSLKDDKNFNIVARMMVSVEECKRYCEEEADRGFKAKFWRPITIKIAIQQ